jgi:PAS domain S-box-containing protein
MDEFAERKEALKEIIKRLHEGADPVKVKEEFKELLKDTSSEEIAKIEEELIKEGMPREEIHKLCDVHIALFKESIEEEKVLAPPGHPIHILMEEHKLLLQFADDLKKTADKIENKDFDSAKEELGQLKQIEENLKNSESHYIREENVLFPYLEKHGITQPPAIMWMEHDKIREIEKDLYALIEAHERLEFEHFVKDLKERAVLLAETLSSHFYKENNILFPTGLKVIPENEWSDIRKGFDELGYCSFTPEATKIAGEAAEKPAAQTEIKGMVAFDTGNLAYQELESIFNTLPVDVTFVDKEDTVRYFSVTKERVFPRTKAVIGRKVQQCHPQKSLHVVNQILEDFKNGQRDVAEFWINLKDRLILIRYFPVQNKNGDYIGCLEVTQDITDIKKIEGEKRLL